MAYSVSQHQSFLLVEDNPTDAKLISRALKSYFTEPQITLATRLKQAKEFLEGPTNFDLILVDLNLPDSRGYETFSQIRAIAPNTPTYILTAFGSEEMALKALGEGAATFLDKEYLGDSTFFGRSIAYSLERSKHLNAIKNSELRLRGILDSTADGIVVTDLNSNILFLNTAASLLLRDANLTLGKTLPFPVQTNQEHTVTLTSPSSSRSNIVISIKSTYSYWNDSPAICFTLRDISDRQKMVDTLIEAQNTANNSNRYKNLFLANMSHELRTPLNGIIGSTSLLADTTLSREQTDYLNTIRSSADFLLTLVNDLLDISKIEAGTIRLENTPFALDNFIKDCLSQYSNETSNDLVSFHLELPEEIPAFINGDPWRIRQILSNLLTNAFKFTKKGNVTFSVKLKKPELGSSAPGTITFTVKDSGCGIDKDFYPHIFTPFCQEKNALFNTNSGAGLGLAISKRLAELLNGSLSFISEVNHGSTFTLTLPYTLPKSDEVKENSLSASLPKSSVAHAPARNNEKASHPPNFKRPPVILVAEDHPINQKLVSAMLEKLGCRVLLANDGKEALERAANTCVDLFFVDCQMPKLDGISAVRQLRQLPQYGSTPIIAMTALVSENDIQECLNAGMDSVLKKPFTKSDIEKILQERLADLLACPNTMEIPVLNSELVAQWKQVMGNDNPAAHEAFLNLFFSTSEELISQADEAFANKDLISLARLLHRFKGSAGHVGAERFTRYLESVENALQNEKQVPEGLISKLKSEVSLLRDSFR